MLDLLNRLWPLQRSLVSDGYDEAIKIISAEIPLDIATYPSGTDCWTWTVPEKWTCSEAYLEDMSGNRIIDYNVHPLHCVDYSMSVDKIVSRKELFEHLYIHEKNPDAIPYVFHFYERSWGLCCTKRTKDTLKDEKYRVVIKTSFSPGELKVGQSWVKGKSDDTVVLIAHLCHPYMANDDLSGVVVGIDLIKYLHSLPTPHYTYLFLLVPETIGTVAWLSHNENRIPQLKGGMFLEMLGKESPHALQLSYEGDSQVDLCCKNVVQNLDKKAFVRSFRKIILNDELEFNSPSFRIPVVSLSRCLSPEDEYFPYPEYHTHLDSPAIIKESCLRESLNVIKEILFTLENNYFPRAKFKGQLFCSKYGLYPQSAKEHALFFDVMFELDGQHSLVDICIKHNLNFREVYDVIQALKGPRLIEINYDRWPVLLKDENLKKIQGSSNGL